MIVPLNLRLAALGAMTACSRAIFRLDPAWCKAHNEEQITDAELGQLAKQLNQIIRQIQEEQE